MIFKVASSALGMGPQHTMSIAERLYLGGLITYPRTESTSYPGKFEFKPIINSLTDANPDISAYANKLLKVNILKKKTFKLSFKFKRTVMKNQELELMLVTILRLPPQQILHEISQEMK